VYCKALLPERLSSTTQLLLDNYPNPFNPETRRPFELAADAAETSSDLAWLDSNLDFLGADLPI